MVVSVVIPVYNVKPYLERCVHSVLNQTYKDLEIILVNDGSTDGSGDLCDQIAADEPRIRVVHQQNQGLSGARNTGIREATGEYVIFLDSDDEWLLTEGLQQIIDIASAGSDLVAFKVVHIYSGKQVLTSDYDVETINSMSTATDVFSHLVYTQQFNMSACPLMVRRQLLVDNNIYFPLGMISEDVFWSLELWQHLQSVMFVNLDFYGYHHREASLSTTSNIRVYESYDQIFTYWKKQCDDGCKNASIIQAYLANMWINRGYAYHRLKKEDKQKALAILLHHSDLLNYGRSRKSKRVYRLVRLIGVRLTAIVLGGYWQLRQHIMK